MTIFKSIYGSHLFGCAVPESDQDYKAVHLETLSNLLFEDTHAVQGKDETGPVKIETESFSLRFYLKMLAQGQVIATDMFFTPSTFWVKALPCWDELLTLKSSVISQKIGPFCGYAKSQSFKYGVKGVKLLTVQKAILLLRAQVPFEKLCQELTGMEGVSFHTEMTAGRPIRHVKICEKSFGETTHYNLWLPPLETLESRYGSRARLSTSGLDVKAQYHTVRICREAIELLRDHTITFPRPEAPLLLKIRTGGFADEALRELVDENLSQLTDAKQKSTLRAEPDWSVINDFIFSTQKAFIV